MREIIQAELKMLFEKYDDSYEELLGKDCCKKLEDLILKKMNAAACRDADGNFIENRQIFK